MALLAYSISLVAGQLLLRHVVAAAAIRGTSIADLSTVNARLTLAIGCVTTGSAVVAGLLACGPAARQGGTLGAAVRAVAAIGLVFLAAVVTATLMHQPVPTGSIALHLGGSAVGLGIGVTISVLASTRGPDRRRGLVAAAAVALAIGTFPASGASADSRDFEPDQCSLSSYSASLTAGFELGPLDAGPDFAFAAIEHPGGGWGAEITVGFELDFGHDFVPVPVGLAAKATGSDLELKVGGRGLARVTNHYAFRSSAELERAVLGAYARVTTELSGFPGLSAILPFEPPRSDLPPAQSTELAFGAGGYVAASAKAVGIAGLELRVQNEAGVRLLLTNPENRSDLAVTPDTAATFDIGVTTGFDVSATGRISVHAPARTMGAGGLSGGFTTDTFLTFARPVGDGSPLAILGFVPTSLSLETTLGADASGMVSTLLGEASNPARVLPPLGPLDLVGRSGFSLALDADLGHLDDVATLHALATLFRAMASGAHDDAGRPLAEPPSSADTRAAFLLVHQRSRVRLTATGSSGVGLEIGGPITPALALSASVEISARRLLQAGFLDGRGRVVLSKTCLPSA